MSSEASAGRMRPGAGWLHTKAGPVSSHPARTGRRPRSNKNMALLAVGAGPMIEWSRMGCRSSPPGKARQMSS